jgi:hypothetical protein
MSQMVGRLSSASDPVRGLSQLITNSFVRFLPDDRANARLYFDPSSAVPRWFVTPTLQSQTLYTRPCYRPQLRPGALPFPGSCSPAGLGVNLLVLFWFAAITFPPWSGGHRAGLCLIDCCNKLRLVDTGIGKSFSCRTEMPQAYRWPDNYAARYPGVSGLLPPAIRIPGGRIAAAWLDKTI